MMKLTETRIRTLGHTLLAALFCGAIALPGLGMWCGWQQSSPLVEQRRFATRPSLGHARREGIRPFTRQAEAYFKDHFGFRRLLVTAYADLMVKLFHRAPTDKIVVGKDGWYFLRSAVDTFRGMAPLGSAELARTLRVYRERQRWLAAQGIPYVLLIVPNKSTIYPEHHPDWVGPRRRPTRLVQLVGALRSQTTIPVIDLTAAMLREKPLCQVFLRTDSHWSDCGAAVAYWALREELTARVPALRGLPRPTLRRTEKAGPGGDLVRMLGLQNRIRERRVVLSPERGYGARTRPYSFDRARWGKRLGRYRLVTLENRRAPARRILVYGDSFLGLAAFRLLLAEHFRRTLLVIRSPTLLDPLFVRWEKPLVVVQELVERNLQYRVKGGRFPALPAGP